MDANDAANERECVRRYSHVARYDLCHVPFRPTFSIAFCYSPSVPTKTSSEMVNDPKIYSICERLQGRFLSSSTDREELSIFLCGGSSKDEASFRIELGNTLSSVRSRYRYSVYYPESMFLELLLGHGNYDLLSLENLLATSVNAVVIPLQSPGTFTELGAFTNHDDLQNKLIVVVDPHYRRAQSFINSGPIRYLRTKTTSEIIYHRLAVDDIPNLTKRVTEATRKIAAKHPVTPTLTNPLACYEFYLALVCVLDPVPRSAILDLARALEPDNKDLAQTVSEAVINGLINERKVLVSGERLSVTATSMNEFVASFRTNKRTDDLLSFLTKLRYEALNRLLRGKRHRDWRGAARA